MQDLTVVIPAWNAATTLPHCLASLAPGDTWLVVDGGSVDDTAAVAGKLGAQVVQAPRGRGSQLQAGAALVRTPWMLFLHADTCLEAGWRTEVAQVAANPTATGRAFVFQFSLDDRSLQARRLERWVHWRTQRLGLPYGDQGLLIHRSLYEEIGGFRAIPIMEDVDIVRRIGRRRLTMLQSRAITSARRWQKEGWLRRSARNLLCLGLYFAGVSPTAIARIYGK